MRDYIGEKRSIVWKFVKETVHREYATDPENTNPKTHQEFWKRKLKDHAILSPDVTKVCQLIYLAGRADEA